LWPPSSVAPPFAAAPPARGVTSVTIVPLPPPAVTAILLAVSLTSMMLVGYIGTMAAIGFLAGWVLLAAAYGRAAMQLVLRGPVLVWLLPGFGVLSVLWSQARSDSLRFALEYAVTIGCAVLSARLLTPRALLVALTAALVATSVVSLLLGRDITDALTGQSTFAGVFGSKNQQGFLSSLMVLAGVALLLDRDQPVPPRLLNSAQRRRGGAAHRNAHLGQDHGP